MGIEKNSHLDIFEKAINFTRASDAKAEGWYPYFIPFEDSEGTTVKYQGRELIMLGSNNYLGLTLHPDVIEASANAVRRFGTSCTGSRFLNGTLALHHELEGRLAKFVGKEAALVFSTGYQTNVGTISAIVGRGDVVITDKEDHASIIDGCMLAMGEMKRFKHNDVEDLDRVLGQVPDDIGMLVVVDGVYSAGGDIAPLPDLIRVCQKHGARLMVDDAHSVGVLGQGRGTAAHFGVTDDVDLIMGTFSKSFASIGGYIAGDAVVVDYIKHHARAMIFSASLPAGNVAAVIAALDVIEKNPGYVQQVWDNANFMKKGLSELGFNIGNSETTVIPIIIGDDMRAITFWRALFDAGVYTNVFIPPAVPPNKSSLRTSYMATHTREQLQQALDILEKVGKELEII